MSQTKLSAYRWVIELLMFFAFVSQTIIWLAPAPILTPIIKSLHISLGSAGLIISVIALCISIFSLLGAVISERLGALRAFLIGIWLLAIGQLLSSYCTAFGGLLACRVIEGVGFGVMIAPPGTLTMQWFGEGEWPWINMVNALCAYIGLTPYIRLPRPSSCYSDHRGNECCSRTAWRSRRSRCCGRCSGASVTRSAPSSRLRTHPRKARICSM